MALHLALFASLIACTTPRVRPPETQPTVAFANGAVVHVEIATTPAEVERGLKGRTSLAPDDGMLFVLDHEQDWIFWMVDTPIPLDIIFITRELTVAGIAANAVPFSDALLRVDAKSLFVVEVNAGWSARHGVVAGMRARFSARYGGPAAELPRR